ncbi:MAG: tRNA (adenosine(37)-N6)-dimethylallyltransferase MiaA [Thermotogaceae bacterium]|nr:tRNA (adenosine(37)-N6)-dimethylallyltransferase MiaA [Thermotogaceae bacterium]
MIPVVYGPTGVGKTEILLEICEEINCQIISMDSRQIYRYMDIGTAKPTVAEQKRVKHYMIDILNPDEYYNAYMYRKDVHALSEALKKENIKVVIVGGTGLYLDALVRGIFEGVPADENIRKELKKLHEQEPGILRKMLEDVDPEAAKKIHPNDLKRAIRALEVYMKTGRKISELQKNAEPSGKYGIIILWRERKDLYDRINKRAEKMVEMGLVEETEKLLEMGYNENLNSMKTIGYKETIDYLKGKYDFSHYLHVLKRNTRHFARRQIIWSRRYKEAFKINLTLDKNPREKLKEKVLEIFSKE